MTNRFERSRADTHLRLGVLCTADWNDRAVPAGAGTGADATRDSRPRRDLAARRDDHRRSVSLDGEDPGLSEFASWIQSQNGFTRATLAGRTRNADQLLRASQQLAGTQDEVGIDSRPSPNSSSSPNGLGSRRRPFGSSFATATESDLAPVRSGDARRRTLHRLLRAFAERAATSRLGVSDSGSEDSRLRVLEVRTGRLLDESIGAPGAMPQWRRRFDGRSSICAIRSLGVRRAGGQRAPRKRATTSTWSAPTPARDLAALRLRRFARDPGWAQRLDLGAHLYCAIRPTAGGGAPRRANGSHHRLCAAGPRRRADAVEASSPTSKTGPRLSGARPRRLSAHAQERAARQGRSRCLDAPDLAHAETLMPPARCRVGGDHRRLRRALRRLRDRRPRWHRARARSTARPPHAARRCRSTGTVATCTRSRSSPASPFRWSRGPVRARVISPRSARGPLRRSGVDAPPPAGAGARVARAHGRQPPTAPLMPLSIVYLRGLDPVAAASDAAVGLWQLRHVDQSRAFSPRRLAWSRARRHLRGRARARRR